MIYAHKQASTSNLREAGARDLVRLRSRMTGDYLHLSATGTTRDVNLSWLGTRAQAETLKTRAEIRGEDWPFRVTRREELG